MTVMSSFIVGEFFVFLWRQIILVNVCLEALLNFSLVLILTTSRLVVAELRVYEYLHNIE